MPGRPIGRPQSVEPRGEALGTGGYPDRAKVEALNVRPASTHGHLHRATRPGSGSDTASVQVLVSLAAAMAAALHIGRDVPPSGSISQLWPTWSPSGHSPFEPATLTPYGSNGRGSWSTSFRGPVSEGALGSLVTVVATAAEPAAAAIAASPVANGNAGIANSSVATSATTPTRLLIGKVQEGIRARALACFLTMFDPRSTNAV